MTEKQDYHKDRHYIIIAGPTASGKSAMALDIARRTGGVIINADSMQIYQDLSVLTARPSEADMQAVPHRLYGVMDGAQNCSVGKWLALAHEEVTLAWQAEKCQFWLAVQACIFRPPQMACRLFPIFPKMSERRLSPQYRKMGAEQFHTLLASHDNEIATRLFPTDTQRVLRAMEVVLHTGTPLSVWQKKPRLSRIEAQAISIRHLPPRQAIYERIEARFDKMIDAGALDEVARLSARKLDPDLPVKKALGVKPLAAVQAGQLDEGRYRAD